MLKATQILKATFATVLLLSAGSSAFATPKPKTLSGNYTASFLLDPGAKPGAHICLAMTTSNGILGFAESGTFVDTNGIGLSGQYIVDGKILHLIFLKSSLDDNIDAIGTPKAKGYAGNFDDFFTGNSGDTNQFANQDTDTGTFTLEPGCSAAALPPRSPTQHSTSE